MLAFSTQTGRLTKSYIICKNKKEEIFSLSFSRLCHNSVFLAARTGENRLLNANNLRNLKIAATTSKYDSDTPSERRGLG